MERSLRHLHTSVRRRAAVTAETSRMMPREEQLRKRKGIVIRVAAIDAEPYTGAERRGEKRSVYVSTSLEK